PGDAADRGGWESAAAPSQGMGALQGQSVILQFISSTTAGLMLKLRNQEACVAAVLFEVFSELLDQHGFFFPCLDPIAEDDQGNPGDASPAVNHQCSTDRG